jgi:hypothetical protein
VTRTERLTYWLLFLFCAATRFLAMARSLWDWDEALFCLGMRAYDVTSHHPHPPGFPVYIGLAKLVRFLVHDDFRALQAINLAAGMLVFPAVFMLARELRFRFVTAAIAGTLCAFLPNVWFFGGTAFSDIPSIVLVVYAVAFFFRGCRDANAYIAGSFLLALAVGIRPQNFLIGFFPGALATSYRARASWRDVVFAALVGVVTVGVAFGGAVAATGSLPGYINTVRTHSDYISTVDSFRSPGRPPLWRLLDRFFIKQYDEPVLSFVVTLLVFASIVGAIRARDRAILYIALAFGPFAILAWLMLDRYSVSRFSIGYIPMFALLAADGIARLTRARVRWEALAGAVLVGAFFLWTLPALTTVRNTVSPPVVAAQLVNNVLDPRRDFLFVAHEMTPFVQYFAPYVQYQGVLDERALPLSVMGRRPWLIAEVDATKPSGGWIFRRPHNRLWNIARRHYFDVALAPMTRLPQFISGWYAPERSDVDEWRWMSAHSVTRLPPAAGPTVLRLRFSVAVEIVPQHPTVTVALNGVIVDRITVSEEHNERVYDVTPAAGGAPNVLELSIDRTLNPAKQHLGSDARDLGVLLRAISFGPA